MLVLRASEASEYYYGYVKTEDWTCASPSLRLVSPPVPKDFKRRWKKSELEPALRQLVTRISAEQSKQGLNDQALAYSADMHPKTWGRYINGEIPTTEAGVERILRLADVVGIPRAESESMVPPPVPISSVPLGTNSGPTLHELVEATKAGAEAMRANGAKIDSLSAKMDTLIALLGQLRR